MTDLLYQSAVGLLADLDARRVSARELLDAHLARHEKTHPEINAVVAVDPERAHADAAQVDDARARGDRLGPLAGLPMTVKDGYDVAGLPATCGVPALVGRPKECLDADVVASARAAGAVLWGKTNVPLMLGDFQTYNEVYGTTNNPYDPARTPGGSSGGSAAALAAGVTPLEIGSDIAGSLRHPANFCGIYALKPTWGALSQRGSLPSESGIRVAMDLAVPGPMARSVADLRLLWDVLRGASGAPPAVVGGGRVALWLDEPEFALSAPVRAAVQGAANALRSEGVLVEPAAPPVPAGRLLDTYLALLFPILATRLPDPVYAGLVAGRAGAVAALERGADRYGPETFRVHATASYREVVRAQLVREELKTTLAAWFADWDAILAPISAVTAFTHRQRHSVAERVLEVDGQPVPYLRMLDWIALATALHAPALAAPVSRDPDGLPIGVQLIGRWGEEDRLLELAGTLERSTGGFHPPGFGR